MGSVQIDIHKHGHAMDQQYKLGTVGGVIKFLEDMHSIRAARLKGDLDAASMLMDFMKAYRAVKLSDRERQALYYKYEMQMSPADAAAQMEISVGALIEYIKRAARKLAQALSKQ